MFGSAHKSGKTASFFMDKSGFGNDNPDTGDVSNASGSDERMFALARRIAAQLARCSPQKRVSILRQAQALWDTQGPPAANSGAMNDAESASAESFSEVTSGWMAAVLNELPLLTRIEVLQLMSQLKENARFDRLAMDVQLEAGE